LIETCHADTEAKANNGWTALLFACHYGQLEIVKYLIETCQVDTDTKSNAGTTAWQVALLNRHLIIIKYLAVNASNKLLNYTSDRDSAEIDTKEEEEFDPREAEIRKQDEVIQARLEKSRELEQRLREQSEEINVLKLRLARLENEPFK
jgi:ankyrin repeat protein